MARSAFLRLTRNDWLFVGSAVLLLLGASLWSRISGDLTSDRIVPLVTGRLASELDLQSADVTIFSVRSEKDQTRAASARLLGKVCTLLFERADREWKWSGIVPESGKLLSVDDYIRGLRAGNEEGALNALRLINTAQVAARTRNGRYGTLDELMAAGLLMVDLKARPSRGYRVELEIDRPSYRAFATPVAHPRSGLRSFYSDETLVLHGADHQGQRASAGDPALEE